MNWKMYTTVNTYSLSHLKTQKKFTKNANDFLQDEVNNKIHCLYYDITDFNRMVATHVNSFSLLYLIIFSLPYHFDEFYELSNSLHIKFNVIGITESHLKLKVQPLVNINLINYNTEETPTESEEGEALLYISFDINYKVLKT